jgi:hypothetical protein
MLLSNHSVMSAFLCAYNFPLHSISKVKVKKVICIKKRLHTVFLLCLCYKSNVFLQFCKRNRDIFTQYAYFLLNYGHNHDNAAAFTCKHCIVDVKTLHRHHPYINHARLYTFYAKHAYNAISSRDIATKWTKYYDIKKNKCYICNRFTGYIHPKTCILIKRYYDDQQNILGRTWSLGRNGNIRSGRKS